MRMLPLLVFAYLAIVFEVSLRRVLTLHELGGVSPSALAVLAVFLALWAPRMTALWCSLVLGLIVDLSSPLAQTNGLELFVPGPNALGFAFATYLIIQIRTMVLRSRVITIAVLAFMFVLASNIVVVATFVVRSQYPDAGTYFQSGGPLGDLAHAAGSGAYSAVLAIPLGWLLLHSLPMWGFSQPMPRVGSAVRY